MSWPSSHVLPIHNRKRLLQLPAWQMLPLQAKGMVPSLLEALTSQTGTGCLKPLLQCKGRARAQEQTWE